MLPVLCLLALAVIIPSACVLWFMTQAVRNERLAVRQQLTQVYTEEFKKFRDEFNQQWNRMMQRLSRESEGDIHAASHFSGLVKNDLVLCSSAIIFDSHGNIEYPRLVLDTHEKLSPFPPELDQMEYIQNDYLKAAERYKNLAMVHSNPDLVAQGWQGQIRCLIKAGKEKEAVAVFLEGIKRRDIYGSARDPDGRLILPNVIWLMDPVIERLLKTPDGLEREDQMALKSIHAQFPGLLTSYNDPMIPASQRRFLMHQLVEKNSVIRYKLSTLDSEDLAAAFLESECRFTTRSFLSPTKQPDLWQARTKNGRVLLLYTIEQLKLMLNRFQYAQVENLDKRDVFVTVWPTREGPQKSSFLQLPAGEALPDFTMGLFFKKGDPLKVAEDRQRTIYIWTALLGITAMGILVGLVGRYQMRQMKVTRLKNDFVATVTHELKTPLASMRLLTDTLLEGRYRDETQVREYLELISRENHRLSRLIDNFLTFSRMERNKRVFDFRKVHPQEIAGIALDSVREKFTAEGVELKVNVEPNLPELTADRDGLVTVLINLLDNACKYSENEKWISLHVYAANYSIFFEVADRGIGMSCREMKNIFERFYQVDQRLSRKVGGCGLGLAIVKFIIDAHGGDIDVTSERTLGSRFVIRIPVDGEKSTQTMETS
jgi:signal transduction histidine kinase